MLSKSDLHNAFGVFRLHSVTSLSQPWSYLLFAVILITSGSILSVPTLQKSVLRISPDQTPGCPTVPNHDCKQGAQLREVLLVADSLVSARVGHSALTSRKGPCARCLQTPATKAMYLLWILEPESSNREYMGGTGCSTSLSGQKSRSSPASKQARKGRRTLEVFSAA